MLRVEAVLLTVPVFLGFNVASLLLFDGRYHPCPSSCHHAMIVHAIGSGPWTCHSLPGEVAGR